MMGNCVAVRRDAVLLGHNGRLGSKKEALHQSSSALTASVMSSLSLSPDALFNDSSSMSDEVVYPVPKQRLSTETSLRLVVADEEELGAIRYQHTCLDDAIADVRGCDMPILCVEVEVPGNDKLGREVLSHPLIVEAAETLFVTVAPIEFRKCTVPIDVPGKHCYTKVRMLDQHGVDLVTPIRDKELSVASMVSAMVEGLNSMHLNVPKYLDLLQEEEAGRTKQSPLGSWRRTERQIVFGMTSSKRGEIEYASLDGVLATRAGYVDHQEVVQVSYDASRLSYCSLVRHGLQRNVARTIYYRSNEERVAGRMEIQRLNARANLVQFLGAIQPSVDPKHALRQTMLRFVPLTGLQSTRANRLVDMGRFNEAMHLLSPRQGQLLMRSLHKETRKELVDVPIIEAWKSLSEDRKSATP